MFCCFILGEHQGYSRFRGIGGVFFRMWDETDETSWLENGSSNWLMNSELDVW